MEKRKTLLADIEKMEKMLATLQEHGGEAPDGHTHATILAPNFQHLTQMFLEVSPKGV